MAMPNKFSGTCRHCGGPVAPLDGLCEKIEGRWVVEHKPDDERAIQAVRKRQVEEHQAKVGRWLETARQACRAQGHGGCGHHHELKLVPEESFAYAVCQHPNCHVHYVLSAEESILGVYDDSQGEGHRQLRELLTRLRLEEQERQYGPGIDKALFASGRHRRAGALVFASEPTHKAAPPQVGEVRGYKKRGLHVLCQVGRPYYHSRDNCEDDDCFCGVYGWKVDVVAVPVERNEAEQAEIDAKKRAVEEAAAGAKQKRQAWTAALADLEHQGLGKYSTGPDTLVTWKKLTALDNDILYRGECDNETVYRLSLSGIDDEREYYYAPEWLARRWALARNRRLPTPVTVEAAKDWLTKYGGCHGADFYRFVFEGQKEESTP